MHAFSHEAAGAMTYQRVPARKSPETLARAHMPLVRKIAWHVHGRVSSAIEVEDLIQIGMIALVEAANAFEDRGHAFATYATMRIRGAMIDHLRRQATLCRSAMTRRKQIAAARARIESRVGREASEAEIAAEMGLEPAAFRALADASSAVRRQAAWALGAIGDARAVQGLLPSLKDPDSGVRKQAAWAIGVLGR